MCQANGPLCSEPSGLLQGALNQPPAQPSEPNHCDAGVMLNGATEVPAWLAQKCQRCWCICIPKHWIPNLQPAYEHIPFILTVKPRTPPTPTSWLISHHWLPRPQRRPSAKLLKDWWEAPLDLPRPRPRQPGRRCTQSEENIAMWGPSFVHPYGMRCHPWALIPAKCVPKSRHLANKRRRGQGASPVSNIWGRDRLKGQTETERWLMIVFWLHFSCMTHLRMGLSIGASPKIPKSRNAARSNESIESDQTMAEPPLQIFP